MDKADQERWERALARLQELSIHDDSEVPDLPDLPDLPTEEGETVAIFLDRKDGANEPTSK